MPDQDPLPTVVPDVPLFASVTPVPVPTPTDADFRAVDMLAKHRLVSQNKTVDPSLLSTEEREMSYADLLNHVQVQLLGFPFEGLSAPMRSHLLRKKTLQSFDRRSYSEFEKVVEDFRNTPGKTAGDMRGYLELANAYAHRSFPPPADSGIDPSSPEAAKMSMHNHISPRKAADLLLEALDSLDTYYAKSLLARMKIITCCRFVGDWDEVQAQLEAIYNTDASLLYELPEVTSILANSSDMTISGSRSIPFFTDPKERMEPGRDYYCSYTKITRRKSLLRAMVENAQNFAPERALVELDRIEKQYLEPYGDEYLLEEVNAAKEDVLGLVGKTDQPAPSGLPRTVQFARQKP